MSNRLFKIGVIGSLATALCCFTPILAIALGALGLAALTAWLDLVLLPLLALFLLLTVFAWMRRRT